MNSRKQWTPQEKFKIVMLGATAQTTSRLSQRCSSKACHRHPPHGLVA